MFYYSVCIVAVFVLLLHINLTQFILTRIAERASQASSVTSSSQTADLVIETLAFGDSTPISTHVGTSVH